MCVLCVYVWIFFKKILCFRSSIQPQCILCLPAVKPKECSIHKFGIDCTKIYIYIFFWIIFFSVGLGGTSDRKHMIHNIGFNRLSFLCLSPKNDNLWHFFSFSKNCFLLNLFFFLISKKKKKKKTEETSSGVVDPTSPRPNHRLKDYASLKGCTDLTARRSPVNW